MTLSERINNDLKEAMKKLNEREKLILNLRFYKGRTQMEVAKELGIDIIYRDIVKGPKVKITIEVEGD